MSGFLNSLNVTPLEDAKTWVLLQPFKYETKEGQEIIAESGFMTDCASIPRRLWVILPRWGKYGKAAVIHDWLYWTKETGRRKIADRIMFEAMGDLSVCLCQKYPIYLAVCIFGCFSWHRNKWDRAAGFNRVLSPDQIEGVEKSDRPGLLKRTLLHYKSSK